MAFLKALLNLEFWAYNIPAVVLLAGGWGALVWYERRGKRLEDLRPLLWSSLFLVGVAIPSVILGHEVFVLVVALLSLFACREFARATGLYEDWFFSGLVYLGILAVNLVAMWAGYLAVHGSAPDNWGYEVFMATSIYGVAGLCLVPVFRPRTENVLQRVAWSIMAFVYFGYFLAHLSVLAGIPCRQEDERCLVYAYVFFLLYGTATADIAGRLMNCWIGGHPVAPRIGSVPTWESCAATLAWAALWSFSLGQTLPSFTWPAMVFSTVVFGILGPLGDLVMRYLLHDLALKGHDEGSQWIKDLALGHLYRLLFVAPLFFRVVHFFDPAVLRPPS